MQNWHSGVLNKLMKGGFPVSNNEQDQTAADFVIGRHPAMAAIKSDQQINKVFIQSGLQADVLNDIAKIAKKRNLIVQYVPKQKLDRLTDNANHQGVAVGVAAFEYATIDDLFAVAKAKNEAPFFLILDNIEDPHNLGSIMRTADAAGAHGIIIPKRRAVGLTSTVAKTSTGLSNT
ncbi:tRNA/rRNA methyltransferase [Lactiplantibacillus plantarum subsp. plantarum]|nr:tRNA/rRNA methyltransferase [Lactiplantibacillus plantarum subsp. plantarum]